MHQIAYANNIGQHEQHPMCVPVPYRERVKELGFQNLEKAQGQSQELSLAA